ncbi:hypothetical protein ADL27_11800 [Streptomyces sp. NRRL F-6602]|nr:hypothetical protein ADL27_11800 [Streptomyces sp. NRRL F-6602]
MTATATSSNWAEVRADVCSAARDLVELSLVDMRTTLLTCGPHPAPYRPAARPPDTVAVAAVTRLFPLLGEDGVPPQS